MNNTLLAIIENNKLYGTLVENDRIDIENLKYLKENFFRNTIDSEIKFFGKEYISNFNLDEFASQITTKIFFDKNENKVLFYVNDILKEYNNITTQGDKNVSDITNLNTKSNNFEQTRDEFSGARQREFGRKFNDNNKREYNINTNREEEKRNLIQNVGNNGEYSENEYAKNFESSKQNAIQLSTQQIVRELSNQEFVKTELRTRIDDLLRSKLSNEIISNFISNFNGKRNREIQQRYGKYNQTEFFGSDNNSKTDRYNEDNSTRRLFSDENQGNGRRDRLYGRRESGVGESNRVYDREFRRERLTDRSPFRQYQRGNYGNILRDSSEQEQFRNNSEQSENNRNITIGQGNSTQPSEFNDSANISGIFVEPREEKFVSKNDETDDNSDNSNILRLHSTNEQQSEYSRQNQNRSNEVSSKQSDNQITQTMDKPLNVIQNKAFKTFSSHQFLIKREAPNYVGKFDLNLTKKERIKANYEALKMTQTILNDTNRKEPVATIEEQDILAKFSGYGGLKELFIDDKFIEQRDELLDLVGEKNYNDLMQSSENAFYTPDDLIIQMYNGLNQLGVNKKEKIYALEPSCGIGKFISLAPSNYEFEAIEKDTLTATIAKLLHPNIKIYNDSLENVDTHREYDVVIGNPPFGQDKIYDYSSHGSGQSIHNYFTIKSSELIKNGGIVNFVISSYFLDSLTDIHRQIMFENGEFISAFRLPISVFQHTEVLTDVFYFSKNIEENKNEKSNIFLKSINKIRYFSNNNEINLNEYFDEKTENMIGTPDVKTNRFGENVLMLEESNWQDILATRIFEEHEFKNDIFKINEPYVEDITSIPFDRLNDDKIQYIENLANGNIFEFENKIYVKDDDNNCHEAFFEDELSLEKQDFIPKNNIINIRKTNFIYKNFLNYAELNICKKIIDFRDMLKEILNDEKNMPNDDQSNFEIATKKRNLLNFKNEILKETNTKFFNSNTRHKKDNNEIITMHNLSSIINLDNIDSYKIYATENKIKDENGKKSYDLSDFMKKRILFPKEITLAKTPIEALAKSINNFGKLKINSIAEYLPNMKLDEILKELTEKKLIFKSLENNEYELASEFFSGNIKAKHKKILKMIDEGVEFEGISLKAQEVANELEKYFPKFVNYEDLEINFGSNYIDIQIYENFIRQTFFYEPDKIQINLSYINGTYILNDFQIINENISNDSAVIEKSFRFLNSTDLNDNALNIMVRNEAGEIKFDTRKMIELVLNNQSLEVKRCEKQDDGSVKTIIELAPTKQAIDNAEIINELFDSFCFNDEKIRKSIEQSYNDKINIFANKNIKFNEYLKFDDLNRNITLRPHQKDVVYRGIMNNSLLLDHQVGAGKTLAGIAIAMEQIRMGIIKKALFLVPNHLTRQWADEFLRAYPNTNILVGDKIDNKKTRKEFLYKARFGEFDAIIMKHSTFENMNVMQSYEKEVISEQIEMLIKILDTKKQEANSQKDENKFQMYLEKRISKLKNKLQKKAKGKKFDNEIAFENLGIDALFVDEAHNFKNLYISTNLQGVKGLPLTNSNKAMKMLCATRYCLNNNYKLYFLTGTPVSNSISEFYIMQNYLQPQILQELGLSSFDDWQKTFTKVTLNEELDSSGVNYKIVPRLSKFINVPELMNIYKQNADIVTNKDIEDKIGKFVPNMKGNAPTNIIIPRSDEIANFIGVEDENGNYNQGSIIYRMENKESRNKNDNMLSLTTEARKAALDYRMIDPFYPKSENSKISALIKIAMKHYNDKRYPNGTQLIFCDMGVSKQKSQKIDISDNNVSSFESLDQVVKKMDLDLIENEDGQSVYVKFEIKDNKKTDKIIKEYSIEELIEEQGDKFDIYADILKELVKQGVPQKEIAFIGDATTDLAKQSLFEKMNGGEIRFLIGSTSKMGAGTNVQRLGVAMHELDCPWRPCDLQQRLGRFIRQGNFWFEQDSNFEISAYRYATEQTYDARMFQVNEQKLRPLAQIKKGDFSEGVRVFDSIDAEVANIAEMKAFATGNMFVLEKHRISNFLQTEERLYENYKKSIILNEKNYKKTKENIEYEKNAIAFLRNIVNLKINENENYEIIAFGIKTTKKQKNKVDENDFKAKNEKIMQNLEKFARGECEKSIIALELKNITLTLYYKFEHSVSGNSKPYIEGVLCDKNKNTFSPQNLLFTNQSGLFVDISYNGMLQRVENIIKNAKHIFSIHNENLENLKDKFQFYNKFLEKNNLKNYNRSNILKTLKEDLKNINEIFRIRNELRKEGIIINNLNAEQIIHLVPKYPIFLNKNGKLEPNNKTKECIQTQTFDIDIQPNSKIESIEIELKKYDEQDTQNKKFEIILENDKILQENRKVKYILE